MIDKRPDPTWKQGLATAIAESFILRKGKRLHEQNANDHLLGNNLWRKFLANLYLILADYGKGEFPPRRPPREEAFQGERTQLLRVEFATSQRLLEDAMRKPWWDKRLFPQHSREIIRIIETMEKCGLQAPAKILELGCGGGWVSEILALRGYAVVGTDISEVGVEHAKLRTAALKAKRLTCSLDFIATPMEEVHEHVPHQHFDAAFCYEALHHVFDWREALNAMDRCIRPGGWLFLFSEPSSLHTYICHRSAKIWKTQEIGFRGRELRKHLRELGYNPVRIERPVWGEGLAVLFKQWLPFTVIAGSLVSRAYWISARKVGS